MKKFLVTLCVLLLAVASLMLCSCEKNDIPSELNGSDIVFVNGRSNVCRVVYPSASDAASADIACASELKSLIGNTTGISPKLTTDSLKSGESYDASSCEILVGATGYPESAEVFGGISYGEYMIKMVGNKLVVAAFSEDAMEIACRKVKNLIAESASSGRLVLASDILISDTVDDRFDDLPSYEGGSFLALTEGGGDSTVVTIRNTNTDQFYAYLEKLSNEGYSEYTTNEMTGNRFATYANSNHTINAIYYAYESTARIIFEPLADPIGLEEDNVYTAVTTSQITMLGLEYKKSDGSYASNGLSMLIRLKDGRFIVIDGGFNKDYDADKLVSLMKSQSAGYLKSGEKITIAAWIITHAHGDHMGMIGSRYAKFMGMTVERFIVNFLSDTERLKAIGSTAYGGNYTSTEGGAWTSVITAAKALGAKVCNVHPGQVLYLADLRAEILYTIDSHYPKLCNALNTTSLVIKMNFDSGDSFMMTGDATGNGFEICAKMYGDYLQSDILQVAHHGYTTWGNDEGTKLGYGYIAPEVLLWPQGSQAYPTYKTKGYNVVLFSPGYQSGGLNANFKEVFVAGKENETVVIPLPYSTGKAIVTRN